MTALFSSPRRFELWRYTVSHGQLLMRSNKGVGAETRIEILFKDVGFMALPTLLEGLAISECAADAEGVPSRPALPPGQSWYRIESGGGDFYVAAGSVTVNEDALEYDEPSGLLTDPAL